MSPAPTQDPELSRLATLAGLVCDAPQAGIVVWEDGVPLSSTFGEPLATPVSCETPEEPGTLLRRLTGPDGSLLGTLYVAGMKAAPTPRGQAGLEAVVGLAAEELLRRKAQKVAAAAPQMLFILDCKSRRATYLNDDATRFLRGRVALELESVHPDDGHRLTYLRQELKHLDARAETELRVRVSEGGYRWLRLSLRVTRVDDAGAPAEVTGVFADITESRQTALDLIRARDQLSGLVTTDELTGVPNKRGLNQRLQLLCAEAERGRKFALLMVDIDHFKKVNDTLGHSAGDRVLHSVATALQRSVRKTDYVARFGGEEFCVLLTDVDGPAALTLAERLRVAVTEVEGPVRVTASFGVALCLSPERNDAAELLEAADQALYRAKRGGRNRVAVARRAMPSAVPAKGPQAAA